jgi:hypothetical protein
MTYCVALFGFQFCSTVRLQSNSTEQYTTTWTNAEQPIIEELSGCKPLLARLVWRLLHGRQITELKARPPALKSNFAPRIRKSVAQKIHLRNQTIASPRRFTTGNSAGWMAGRGSMDFCSTFQSHRQPISDKQFTRIYRPPGLQHAYRGGSQCYQRTLVEM